MTVYPDPQVRAVYELVYYCDCPECHYSLPYDEAHIHSHLRYAHNQSGNEIDAVVKRALEEVEKP